MSYPLYSDTVRPLTPPDGSIFPVTWVPYYEFYDLPNPPPFSFSHDQIVQLYQQYENNPVQSGPNTCSISAFGGALVNVPNPWGIIPGTAAYLLPEPSGLILQGFVLSFYRSGRYYIWGEDASVYDLARPLTMAEAINRYETRQDYWWDYSDGYYETINFDSALAGGFSVFTNGFAFSRYYQENISIFNCTYRLIVDGENSYHFYEAWEFTSVSGYINFAHTEELPYRLVPPSILPILIPLLLITPILASLVPQVGVGGSITKTPARRRRKA
jgi:hypothetical protein